MTDHTPDDLRGMGLVTLAEYEALQAKYGALENTALELRYEIEDLADKAKILLPMPAPQPTREFQVGDKVRIVKSTPWRGHHSGTSKVGLVGVIKRDTRNIPHDSTDWVIETTDGDGYCMTADLELISAAPEIPDWIAEGLLIASKEYPKYGTVYKIKKIDGDYVYAGDLSPVSISYITTYYKPFTPPPMPELPRGFAWCKEWITFMDVTPMPVKAWAVAIQAHPDGCYLSGLNKQETVNQLLAIQAHIEKWGTE